MARRSQQERNERALQRLRELGVDPGPLKGAEFRLRKALGARRGLSAGQAVGKPRRGEPSITKLVKAHRIAPARRPGKGRPRKIIDTPAGRVISSKAAERTRQRELRRAAREGRTVEARVIVKLPDGSYATRTIRTDDPGGWLDYDADWDAIWGDNDSYGGGQGQVMDVQLFIR